MFFHILNNTHVLKEALGISLYAIACLSSGVKVSWVKNFTTVGKYAMITKGHLPAPLLRLDETVSFEKIFLAKNQRLLES